jgi:hypothetical protein
MKFAAEAMRPVPESGTSKSWNTLDYTTPVKKNRLLFEACAMIFV